MPSFIKVILFVVGVFAVFLIISIGLKLVSTPIPDGGIINMVSENDLLIGLVVSVVVTFTHIQRKKLSK